MHSEIVLLLPTVRVTINSFPTGLVYYFILANARRF